MKRFWTNLRPWMQTLRAGKMKMLVLITVFLVTMGAGNSNKLVIHLIGDSTMADKPLDDNPERGWGQVFPLFFNKDVTVINYARNGRSTKSFIDQGLWQKVYDNLKPGDYVLIQFGHNDAKKSDTTRYAAPHTAYRDNLVRFVKESRARGAVPVLITPVSRRKFSKDGVLVDTHGDYPGVVKEVAAEYKVPVIDLHASSMKLLSELGPEKSEQLFLRAPAGVYKAFPEGKSDNTHFNRSGAIQIAQLVIQGMKEIDLPVVKYLKTTPGFSNEAAGKVVGLDYFYNHEFRENKEGKKEQFHYIWEDRENSGFYVLGNLFENRGAFLSEVKEAPTTGILDKLSIYIIVDPDTPKETASPNYMDSSAAETVSTWVKNGGVLLLMGNDAGNAEFQHFNILAEKFGIHFNEVSEHPVEGKKYDMGQFVDLPDHPIFKGVKKIYMKEISTLRLSGPARPVLSEDGEVVIAVSNYGTGLVCAIGDPWLYNEYIDNRKLPDDFENYLAAKNLVKWLLSQAKPVR